MASMLSSWPASSMVRVAIARAMREARPSLIAFAAPLPITSRTPFPARRRLATIDIARRDAPALWVLGKRGPAGMPLARDISLAGFALRIERIELLLEPV